MDSGNWILEILTWVATGLSLMELVKFWFWRLIQGWIEVPQTYYADHGNVLLNIPLLYERWTMWHSSYSNYSLRPPSLLLFIMMTHRARCQVAEVIIPQSVIYQPPTVNGIIHKQAFYMNICSEQLAVFRQHMEEFKRICPLLTIGRCYQVWPKLTICSWQPRCIHCWNEDEVPGEIGLWP